MSTKGKFSKGTLAGASNTAPQSYTAKPRGKPDADKYKATLFLPRPIYERLRGLAVDRNTSLQQLLLEAVDMWLPKQGQGGKTIRQVMDEQAKQKEEA